MELVAMKRENQKISEGKTYGQNCGVRKFCTYSWERNRINLAFHCHSTWKYTVQMNGIRKFKWKGRKCFQRRRKKSQGDFVVLDTSPYSLDTHFDVSFFK